MEAVVFDLDGVVVDSEKYWNQLEKKIYAQTVSSGSVNTDKLAGKSIPNTYNYLSNNYNVRLSLDEFFNLYEDQAQEVYEEKASLMPGLKDLIKDLRSKDLKIGLATGSYWPNYVIARFELDFDAVVDSSMVEGNGKPEPETYRMAVERLDVNPDDAVAVDDTAAGIKSAKQAGLYCIGYKPSGDQNLSEADETVKDHKELRDRLLKIVETP